jgi:hypothetical protein
MKDVFEDEIKEQPRKEKVLLEKDIQSACVAWMRGRGYWARKFSSPANRSVTDYLFSHFSFGKFAVEFKAPGKVSTKAQDEEQQLMRDAGWEVWVDIDDIDYFKDVVLSREDRMQRLAAKK